MKTTPSNDIAYLNDALAAPEISRFPDFCYGVKMMMDELQLRRETSPGNAFVTLCHFAGGINPASIASMLEGKVGDGWVMRLGPGSLLKGLFIAPLEYGEKFEELEKTNKRLSYKIHELELKLDIQEIEASNPPAEPLATPTPETNVRVKPLVWKDEKNFGDEPNYSEAVGALYTYVAEAVDGGSLDEAKVKAEQRYEAAILSALNPPPQPITVGDNGPRYSMKRMRDEIANAKAYARREALKQAAVICDEKTEEWSGLCGTDGCVDCAKQFAAEIRALAATTEMKP